MATALTAQASSPSLDAAHDAGRAKYIVAFDDDSGLAGAMDGQIGTFAADDNVQVLERYGLINALAISVPAEVAAEKLNQLPGVRYVEKDVRFRASLERSAPQVGAPVAWGSGLTGKGVTVCVVDSGIDGSHPDLKGRIVGWKDFVAGKTEPYDDFGHGTHCAGIIAGTGAASGGRYRGVAPEAKLIGVKVLSTNGSGDESDILAGLQYAADSDAKVISLSLGSDEHSQAICEAVSRAVQRGKIVVCAAGNSGPMPGTVGCPSHNRDVITVGAVDRYDRVCPFSSRGPAKDGCVKPDVAAPGHQVVSCRAAGIRNERAVETYYLSMSGTSMACPMVSGTVALMVQKDPALTAQRAKEILTRTAKPLGAMTPNGDCGYGEVSIRDILAYMDGNWTAPAPSPKPSPGPSPGPSPAPGCPGSPWPTPAPSPAPVYPGYPGSPCPQYPGHDPGVPGSYFPVYPIYS